MRKRKDKCPRSVTTGDTICARIRSGGFEHVLADDDDTSRLDPRAVRLHLSASTRAEPGTDPDTTRFPDTVR
jgi:hypothetical protein